MMDVVVGIYSPEGRKGYSMYTCAADQTVRGKTQNLILVWIFDKKKVK
jgi:hypothetical protein